MRDNGIDRLTFSCGRRKHLVHFLYGFFVWMDAATAIDENAFVVCLCARGDIVTLLEGAITFLFASIANKRCTIKFLANGLAEVGAGFKAARGVFPSDFLEAIEDHPLAFIKSRT